MYKSPASSGVFFLSASGLTGYSPKSQEINQLVLRYRAGDSAAGAELLNLFKPLLSKYKIVLWYGKVSTQDREVRRFLRFFNPDPQAAAELLSKSLRRSDQEDLEQILAYSLLEGARKYNKVSAGLRFTLKEEIARVTRDALSHRTTTSWDCSQDTYTQYASGRGVNHIMAINYDRDSDIDLFVLEGSATPGFNQLTEQERGIAKLSYIDNISNDIISKEMGLTVRQVRRYIQKIRKKLKVLSY